MQPSKFNVAPLIHAIIAATILVVGQQRQFRQGWRVLSNAMGSWELAPILVPAGCCLLAGLLILAARGSAVALNPTCLRILGVEPPPGSYH